MSDAQQESGMIVQPSLPNMAVFGSRSMEFAHNFTGDKRQMWKMIALCKGASPRPLSEHIGEVINLRYYYVHKVDIFDKKSNKNVPGIRSVLIDDEGNMFDCAANGVAQSLADIVASNGGGEFDPPYSVIATKVKTRMGFDTLVLEPAAE